MELTDGPVEKEGKRIISRGDVRGSTNEKEVEKQATIIKKVQLRG